MDQTRGVTSLKYAHVERERRWLLGAVPGLPDDARRLRIVDRYLRRTRLRLREVTEIDGTVVRKLGHKVRLGDDAREVAHTSLYLDGAEWSVLAALPAPRTPLAAAYLVACGLLALVSVAIHYRGATQAPTWLWNEGSAGVVAGVDQDPNRVWSWSDPQFLRGLDVASGATTP